MYIQTNNEQILVFIFSHFSMTSHARVCVYVCLYGSLIATIFGQFLHSVIFIDWMYWDRWGPEIPGLSVRCLSVCASVCVSVCSRQYGETTGPISMKLYKNDSL